jgi:hypothetical protein
VLYIFTLFDSWLVELSGLFSETVLLEHGSKSRNKIEELTAEMDRNIVA